MQVWKVDEYHRQGKALLERCDKLLNSIAEMAAEGEAGESQPSPVSVLDASLYHEESSPSPVMKRSLDFTGISLVCFFLANSLSLALIFYFIL